MRREKTAKALAEKFVELYEKRYSKAGSVFEAGIGSALTYLRSRGPPCPNTYDVRAGALVQGGEEADEGSGDLPERDERRHVGRRVMLRSSEERR